MEITMKHFTYYIIILVIGIMLGGCAKLQENATQPPGVVLTVHKTGIMIPGSPDFHGNLVRNNNWSMKSCQQCHAADFSGGTAKVACTKCHTQPDGPLACNTCHGDFNDPTRIAPPRDTNDSTSTVFITIGAHTSHLYENDFAIVACQNCHKVPSSVYAPGHIGLPPAPVIFDSIAVYNIASPNWNRGNASCSNVYCHGDWEFKKSDAAPERQFAYTSDKMTGNNKTVFWTKLDDTTQAECGSCHDLPPKGHIPVSSINQCAACHPTVINEQGEIIDKSKHVNGRKDFSTGKK
jgi:predicted CxxxxCH...CXXCH cytochrome family protein